MEIEKLQQRGVHLIDCLVLHPVATIGNPYLSVGSLNIVPYPAHRLRKNRKVLLAIDE